MAFDLKAYRDKNAHWYGDDPLESVARDLYDRVGPEYHQDAPFEDWAKSTGIRDQIDLDAKDREAAALEAKNREELSQRGVIGDLGSDIARGIVGAGKGTLQTMHGAMTFARQEETDLARTLQSGIEGIDELERKHSFLQDQPDRGFLGRAIHGGIESAVQSEARKLPGTVGGIVTGAALGGPAGAFVGGVIGRSLAGGAGYGLSQYDDVMTRGMAQGAKDGLSPDESRAKYEPTAIREGMYEGGFEFLGDLLEGATMGAGKLITAPGKQAAKVAVKDLFNKSWKSIGKRMAGTAAIESGSEMITAGAQAEEERAVGLGDQRFWTAALDAFGPSFVAGLIFGGYGQAARKYTQSKIRKQLENPEADPETRAAIANEVYAGLQQYDPVVAETWRQTAYESIANKQAISANDNILDQQARIQALRQGLSPAAQKEAEKEEKKLQGLWEKEHEKELPVSQEDLELERQYMESVKRVLPEDQRGRASVDKRIGQLDEAIEAEEDYQIRRERLNQPGFQLQPAESQVTEEPEPLTPVAKSAKASARVFEQEAGRLQSPVGRDLLLRRLSEEAEAARWTGGPRASLPPRTIRHEIEQAANEAATSPTNNLPEPTEAQKEAGNYKKGHIALHGLDISIENPKGSERKGVSPEGKPWSTRMQQHYGYIRKTEGRDGDHIDTFIGDDLESPQVFVVDQVDPKTGKFDEHKVMLGFKDEASAQKAYLSNYEKGWKGLGAMTPTSVDEFKKWAHEGDTRKPFAPQKPEALPDTSPESEKPGARDLLSGQKYDVVMKPPGAKRATKIKGLTYEKKEGTSHWFRGPKGNLEIFTQDSLAGVTPAAQPPPLETGVARPTEKAQEFPSARKPITISRNDHGFYTNPHFAPENIHPRPANRVETIYKSIGADGKITPVYGASDTRGKIFKPQRGTEPGALLRFDSDPFGTPQDRKQKTYLYRFESLSESGEMALSPVEKADFEEALKGAPETGSSKRMRETLAANEQKPTAPAEPGAEKDGKAKKRFAPTATLEEIQTEIPNLHEITVQAKAIREKTGEIITVPTRADVALKELDEAIDLYRDLLECVGR